MDEADRAQLFEEAERAAALARVSERVVAQQWVVGPQVLCLDCAQPVPAARLAVLPHAGRCVACQEIHERGGDGGA